MEEVQSMKILAAQANKGFWKEQSLASLKVLVMADLREAGSNKGGTCPELAQCTEALDSLLGQPQLLSMDVLSSAKETFYPEANAKVSMSVVDMSSALEGPKPYTLPYIPDLLFYLLSGPANFDSIPHLAKVLSPTLWDRCTVLVPDNPVSVYGRRPFTELLKQAGVSSQTVAEIPFVLLPDSAHCPPLRCLQRIAELFTVSVERAAPVLKSTLVSVNASRLSPAYIIDYAQLPMSVAEWPIALTKRLAERILTQLKNVKTQWKNSKLATGALKLTAPIMEKLRSTMV